MREGSLVAIGGEGKVVEADETYFGNKAEITTRTKRGKSGLASKRAVLGLLERGGKIRTFHVDEATKATVNTIISANIAKETRQ